MRYAVIVKKHILEPGSKPALSASLSAVLGARQEQILTMLDRGPLTIEADLSRAEARALCDRLIKRAIPAQPQKRYKTIYAQLRKTWRRHWQNCLVDLTRPRHEAAAVGYYPR